MKWIPWKRYVLTLTIDKQLTYNLGRFRMRKSAALRSDQLAVYKGFSTKVIDTKHNRVINQPVDKDIYYRQLRWEQKNRKELER